MTKYKYISEEFLEEGFFSGIVDSFSEKFMRLNKNFKEFFKARSRAILIPYAGLSIISIVFYKFYFNMPIYDTTTIINMVIMFVKATRNQIFYNIPL